MGRSGSLRAIEGGALIANEGRDSWKAAAGAALLTLVWLAVTEPFLAIVWDEGYTLGREARVRSWLWALVDPAGFAETWRPPAFELVQPDGEVVALPPTRSEIDTRAELFQKDVLAYFWPFAREEPHGHPPFYALLGLIGDLGTPWRRDLGRARFGPMLLFSLTAGVLFRFLDRRFGRWAAIGGCAALVLQPRLFAHAHYAAYDAPLTALWVLGVLAFFKAVEPSGRRQPPWPWVIAFGVAVGAASATKLTGWFLPLPCLAWAALNRDRRGFLTLLVGGFIALATIYVFIPPWWPDPIDGFSRFLASNLSRGETIAIKTQFLGDIYETPRESLPWWNTLVWTVFVTPVGFLLLALGGLIGTLRRPGRHRFGALVALYWLFLLALRAMPHVPGHDGVRLFLPAFGLLAVLAGLGSGMAADRFGRWGRAAVVLAGLEGLASCLVMMPVPLSYYSPVVGGLPGAARLGMEPTYYWDGLNGAAIDWLNENTNANERIVTTTFSTSFVYLRQSGRLEPPVLPIAAAAPAWFVIQNRPGDMNALDRWLIEHGEPAFVSRKFGVPILWIFPYEQVERFLAGQSSRLEARSP